MAGNFRESGDRVKFDPAATVSSGDLVVTGTNNLAVICLEDGVSGDTIVGAIRGLYEVPVAAAAVAKDVGDPAYLITATGEITDTDNAAANPQVGTFAHDELLNLNVLGT